AAVAHAEQVAHVREQLVAGLLEDLARRVACGGGADQARAGAHVRAGRPLHHADRRGGRDTSEARERRGETDLLARLPGCPRPGAHANTARWIRPPTTPSTAPCARSSHSSSRIAERIISEKSAGGSLR